MNIPRSYRRLLIAYPKAWRNEYGDIALTALLDVHAATGREHPSVSDRARFFTAGMSRRLNGPPRRPLPPLIAPGHHFDQTNGIIVEREQSAAELASARWSDHEPTATTVRWGWWVADPNRPRHERGATRRSSDSSARRTAR